MTRLNHTLAAAAAFGVLALAPTGASAMPNGLPSISRAAPSNVEDVRWVCGPRRCWWRPDGIAATAGAIGGGDIAGAVGSGQRAGGGDYGNATRLGVLIRHRSGGR